MNIHFHSLKIGLLLLLAAMTGCSDREADGPLADPDWSLTLSRTVTGGANVTVALRYDGRESSATLVPAETEGGTATWLDGAAPQWPADAQTRVEAIALCPVVDALPATVSATDGKAWLLDYRTCTAASKPQSFTLVHLMSQLEVHIRLHDDAEHHYQPLDGTAKLCSEAVVNYAEKRVDPLASSLGDFVLTAFSREDNSYGSDENWVNTAQVVVPQTLEAGKPCLTFRAGDETYTFVPDTDIRLHPGKKTKLYLGVAYENAYVHLLPDGVVVADWETGGSIDAGEAEEQ